MFNGSFCLSASGCRPLGERPMSVHGSGSLLVSGSATPALSPWEPILAYKSCFQNCEHAPDASILAASIWNLECYSLLPAKFVHGRPCHSLKVTLIVTIKVSLVSTSLNRVLGA